METRELLEYMAKIGLAPIDYDNPAIVRYYSLCFHCGSCRYACHDLAGVLGHYDPEKAKDNTVCIYCGQCANECPGFALNERPDYLFAKGAVWNKNKILIANTSPAVRASISEGFGLGTVLSEGKLVALLKKLGFSYVLDTNFAADLTIMEEATELVSRIKNGGTLPMFTSCCPAWVRYAEIFHPEVLPNISSVKSPIGMQGPIVKSYFAKKVGIDPKDILNVTIAPCTAKKYEITLPDRNAAGVRCSDPSMRDMDMAITTREIIKWAKEDEIDFDSLEEMEYDSLTGSGAGAIFGATGGVMEAALRTGYYLLNGVNPPEKFMELEEVRGLEGVRKASIDMGVANINVAVIYGTANAGVFLEKIKETGEEFQFIEVMSCPGGCSGGGGQPKGFLVRGGQPNSDRVNALYSKDKAMTLRFSHENPEIKALYDEMLGKPGSELAKELLHTSYTDRSGILAGEKM